MCTCWGLFASKDHEVLAPVSLSRDRSVRRCPPWRRQTDGNLMCVTYRIVWCRLCSPLGFTAGRLFGSCSREIRGWREAEVSKPQEDIGQVLETKPRRNKEGVFDVFLSSLIQRDLIQRTPKLVRFMFLYFSDGVLLRSRHRQSDFGGNFLVSGMSRQLKTPSNSSSFLLKHCGS